MLSPSAGPLGRHPLGGRNWEGFGADPYLTGVAMALTIEGIQVRIAATELNKPFMPICCTIVHNESGYRSAVSV